MPLVLSKQIARHFQEASPNRSRLTIRLAFRQCPWDKWCWHFALHMKKVLFATTVGMACISAFAQGTLVFANAGPGVNARIFYGDVTTPLAGPGFQADLYWAAGTVTDSTLLAALGAPEPFHTGAQAGYFTGGQRSIPGEPGGSVITAQVRAWGGNFATWGAAAAGGRIGESILFQVTLGAPPTPPPFMTGLRGFIVAPEPSGIALAGLGLLGMMVFRRRK
jgi:hypothetical protein